MQQKFNLGDKVRDKYTRFEGWVHAITKYITGCDRCLVNQRALDDKGQPKEATWFDDTQLELVQAMPVEAPAARGGPPPSGESGLRNA